ncbi:protein ABIL2 isoform X2 [Daucus carota subsp. sativus]|uniref:protein ABIL2 isoform X2 n=1 Tax=Daucus carota subsp. sativus TaxID=79200 RepID=UPI0007EFF320|nr:PREDICTED: protein ABIL2-like isoform X2 [Daucus carota subsp. sativus]
MFRALILLTCKFSLLTLHFRASCGFVNLQIPRIRDIELQCISIMKTMMSSSKLPLFQELDNYDEFSMQQDLLFSDSLKDLKNLRKQLYSAAEFFEISYSNDDSKQIVVSTLKDYAIKALVNTVDHLGSATYKVNDLLDEKVYEVSGTETCVSSIEQRLRTCQTHLDREGLSEQSLMINTPKYHKHYILSAGETRYGANQPKTTYKECVPENQDHWHEIKNAVQEPIVENQPSSIRKGRPQSLSPRPQQPVKVLSTKNMARKDLVAQKRTVSPHRFPLSRAGSLSSRPTTPNSRATTPTSRSSKPNQSRSTTPNSKNGYPSEPRKSGSMHLHSDRGSRTENHQIPTKASRLLKALLSRRKSKKDDTLYTYLDEYY